ncbi:MAG: ATP synthase F1 subunit gamma [Lachnospiraceae bacterium]|nr:ATP synthase F1 subunit gamma [Lachnospiraceae bacterium]
MANIREIKSRIQSIQDTMKITNAMYMISQTKLRKAKRSLDETEEYFITLQNMMDRILRHLPDVENKYFDKRPKKAPSERVTGIIAVTADKGLAGAYNHNVIRLAERELSQRGKCRLFIVGEVGRRYFANKGVEIAEEFKYTAQNPTLHRARIISETVIDEFLRGELDEVYIIYTGMRNGMVSDNESVKLLPMGFEAENDVMKAAHMASEKLKLVPGPDEVINNIVPDIISGYVYSTLVEAFCAEQSARMLAMESANNNAGSMIHDLSIEYNRVRQALITQEITEVIAGAKAQKKKKARKVQEA